MKRIALVLGVALLATCSGLLIGCGDDEEAVVPEGTSTIAGTVEQLHEDNILLAAVAGVSVTLVHTAADGAVSERTVVTDAAGTFEFSGIAAGDYTVEFSYVTTQGRPGIGSFGVSVGEGERIDLVVDLSYGIAVSLVPDEVPQRRTPSPKPAPAPEPSPPGITFCASGRVDYITAPLDTVFATGMAFTVEYRFEPATPPLIYGPTDIGYTGAIYSVTVKVGPYVATGTTGDIRIVNSATFDAYYVLLLNGALVGPDISGFSLEPGHCVISLTGDTTALSTTALPLTPPDPAVFSANKYLTLHFGHPAVAFAMDVSGTIDSFVVK